MCVEGGAIIEISISAISVHVAKVVLNVLAKRGLLVGLATADGGVVINNISATAVSTYLCDSFQQNLPDVEKKNLSWLVEKKYI